MNKKIHDRNHIIKNLLGNIESVLAGSARKDELLVVNYHGTQKKFIPDFIQQIDFFRAHYDVIRPDQISSFYKGELKSTRGLLLITFDDGIKNNLFAAEILNRFQLKAYFFVIPEFINTPAAEQKKYFLRDIRPLVNEHVDSKEEDFTAMNWNDLKGLINEGHSIGSHTQTHRLIASESIPSNSEKEIVMSKAEILSKLEIPKSSINSFCSINNTLQSVSGKELTLIKENYDFHFTTIPGANHSGSCPYYIKRANIESHWLPGAVKYALGKWDLKRWKDADKAYTKILTDNTN
ncbi:MAG: polysaccharide deacetylase family protein [Bacteroidota bacterium]|nr:polysaccharide deacetylase family protein [Bacteroidota bacterium]